MSVDSTGEGDDGEELLASIFEERAEHLSKEDLRNWTQITAGNRKAIAKLTGPGAKLLTGPRGSGKSSLLRAAYFQLLEGTEALPVYVNYANSMALEPLFHRRANALQIFRQWVIAKILVAAQSSINEIGRQPPSDLASLAAGANAYLNALSIGADPPDLERHLGPSQTASLLAEWSRHLGRRRVVLLLDDAAHAFSAQQQREFFEIFRELRTRYVAPKAAVYPGITSYSPYLHVGNDAELVEAWFRPEAAEYLTTMRNLVERRLTPKLKLQLADRTEIVDYLALASFGLPRGFLVMLSKVLGLEEDDANASPLPTRRAADAAISSHADSVRAVFNSLAEKMPRYRSFVELGDELETALVQAIRRFNTERQIDRKAVVVAISQPIGTELLRVLDMLEYSGAIRKLDSVSRGVKGVFQRYEVHYALLLKANALALGRSPSAAGSIEALRSRDAHAFVRTTGEGLLGKGFVERCRLDLAPCQVCGSARLSEEAQYCMRCGNRLSEASIYEELLQAPISRLGLTPKKLESLKKYTSIRTVKDIILDQESVEIRKAHQIGAIWAKRIQRYAEEYVNV